MKSAFSHNIFGVSVCGKLAGRTTTIFGNFVGWQIEMLAGSRKILDWSVGECNQW